MICFAFLFSFSVGEIFFSLFLKIRKRISRFYLQGDDALNKFKMQTRRLQNLPVTNFKATQVSWYVECESFFLNYLRTNRGKTKRCQAKWKKCRKRKQTNIICVTRHVSAGAKRMLTDASNILSDNIASLKHGKPILKTACTFSYALHIRQNFERVRLFLGCNEVKTSLEVAVNWREEKKISDIRFEIEKKRRGGKRKIRCTLKKLAMLSGCLCGWTELTESQRMREPC